jgi:hypothetical protein
MCWIGRYGETGTICTNYHHNGRQRVTTPDDDLNMVLAAMEDPFRTLSQVRDLLNLDISIKTISKRISESGLFSRIAAKKGLLTEQHKQRRLEFANQFVNWPIDNWFHTICVDECTFCTTNEGLVRVWRPLGTRFDEKYLQYVNRSGRRSVSCWGALTADGLSDLVRIHGHLDRFQYCDILEDNAIPFINGLYGDFLQNEQEVFWLADNSPIHTAGVVQDFFALNVPANALPWPPRSPDLNPIEHIWARIKNNLKNNIWRNEHELWDSVYREWNSVANDVDFLHNLISSMPRRLNEVIDKNGGSTKY